MRPTLFATTALLALATACQGRIGDPDSGEIGPGSGPDSEYEPAFKTQNEQPQLLPFWVRLERVASVVGRPTDDPMFDDLRQNRLLLGDYDYASGVKPDRMWTPARMSLWAKSLRSVCASEAMHSLYPALGTDLAEAAELASDAWGRTVTVEELGFDAPNLASLNETQRFEVVCLGVLSATEFVIQ